MGNFGIPILPDRWRGNPTVRTRGRYPPTGGAFRGHSPSFLGEEKWGGGFPSCEFPSISFHTFLGSPLSFFTSFPFSFLRFCHHHLSSFFFFRPVGFSSPFPLPTAFSLFPSIPFAYQTLPHLWLPPLPIPFPFPYRIPRMKKRRKNLRKKLGKKSPTIRAGLKGDTAPHATSLSAASPHLMSRRGIMTVARKTLSPTTGTTIRLTDSSSSEEESLNEKCRRGEHPEGGTRAN